MTAKTMLGIHAANIGGVLALIAKVAETVCKRMYPKLKASPIPRYSPIPPFRLRDESDNPMSVRINEENDIAIRLWYSTSYCTTLPDPRLVCFEI